MNGTRQWYKLIYNFKTRKIKNTVWYSIGGIFNSWPTTAGILRSVRLKMSFGICANQIQEIGQRPFQQFLFLSESK